MVISGLDHIEPIGNGMVRLVWYVNRQGEGGTPERAPTKFDTVVPESALAGILGEIVAAISRSVFVKPDGSVTLLQ